MDVLFWVDDDMEGQRASYWYSKYSSCNGGLTPADCQHGTYSVQIGRASSSRSFRGVSLPSLPSSTVDFIGIVLSAVLTVANVYSYNLMAIWASI